MVSNFIVLGQAAAPAGANGAGGMGSGVVLIGWVAIFGVMIFFMFRNQRKQAQQRQQMLDQLKAGDRVLTAGGIYGKITKVKEKSFMVEIAEKIEIEVAKTGVSGNAAAEVEAK